MTSPWADLDRPPLSERALRAALIRPDSFVTDLRVVPETGSTNDDVAALARAGAAEGTVLVAEAQTTGRGRLDRSWSSPPRSGLTFSVLLRPAFAPARRTWIPLLTGLAVHRAVARLGAVETRLKWPNDLLLGDELGKAAGILAQSDGDAVIVGIGLNVSTERAELPPGAASLRTVAAECTDRDPLLRAILRAFGDLYRGWSGDPARLRPEYEDACDTIGRDVRVQLPDGSTLTGTATGLDDAGRLVVRTADGDRPVSAGDVTRVRPVTAR
ncbi:MAG TPA: biotin--[acetyl-CoA-carboxylase] ligase [Mycobacteriales bacterium]|nr:biotin--[acetyl-CoA-carboxylase] ligase [Mycobacteriales bacterium]